ncbi:MAG: glycosyltransferase family 4 protein [Terriglobia bacterium]
MKLTIVGPAYPLRGGIAHHVIRLKQELTSRGHQVQILSFRRLYPRLFFPGRTPLDSSQLRPDDPAEPVIDSLNPLTWYQAYKRARSFSPDGIVLEWWHPFFSLLVGWLGRRFRKVGLKCIIECHNIFPHERTFLDHTLLRFAFSPVQYFLTHSSTDQQELLKLLPGRTVRIAPLLILKEFSTNKGLLTHPRTLLFFGIVRKYKGLDVLLRAMPRVLSKIDCQLVIAGEFYEPVDRYLQIIRECGIEQSVSIDNRYVPNEEVSEVFGRADVLILPYLSASQSGVAQISFANAVPVIASRTGGLPDVVFDNVNGMLVAPGDSKALAEAILSYFENNREQILKKNLLAARVHQDQERNNIGTIIEDMVGGN